MSFKFWLCLFGWHDLVKGIIKVHPDGTLSKVSMCMRCAHMSKPYWHGTQADLRKMERPDVSAVLSAEAKRQRKNAKRAGNL